MKQEVNHKMYLSELIKNYKTSSYDIAYHEIV